jgi:hypothetical protein
MKKILNIINQIFSVIAYGSGMTLVVIGLSSGFSVLELVLIATCTAILNIGLSNTLKNLEED